MKFPPLSLLVLDTETTGFVPGLHRVIEYACLVIKDGKIEQEYEQLISVEGDEIPAYVQVMTQIRSEDLVGKPTFGDVFETMEKMLKKDMIIVGQNAKFDVSMLRGEGWDLSDVPVIDTAMLASLVYPEIKSYSLSYLSSVLELDHSPKHRALGDVRATAALFSKCWERLMMLGSDERSVLADLARRGPEGYRQLFQALADMPVKKTKRPEWITGVRTHFKTGPVKKAVTLPAPPADTVQFCEEALEPSFLPAVIKGADANTWIAAKNIDSLLRRLPRSENEFGILPSPDFMLSKEAAEKFLNQKQFTADELTLAMKLRLYSPETKADLPLHGEEYQLWSGKLACNAGSPEYLKRRAAAVEGPVLVSHFELLQLAQSATGTIPKGMHLIIDDGSMLEDTATQALGWLCLIPTLRAAAQGDELLTRCTDLVELWIEKTRGGLDLKYISEVDLETDEAVKLKRLVEEILAGEVPHAPRRALTDLTKILAPENLATRIVWIENFIDGSKSIRSVPENVAATLSELLYRRFRVTLLVPKNSTETLSPIVSPDEHAAFLPPVKFPDVSAGIRFPIGAKIGDLIATPEGKAIFLVASKRTIEDIYVKHAEQAETAGITLLCQGFSGGQSRMQAEFSVAPSPALLVVTPWIYETMELPPKTVDRLVIQALPFDHPSHAVFNRRSQRFQHPFPDYAFPRLRNRLFRLIRTFCRHCSNGGMVDILDDRLRTKPYGKELTEYLKSLIPLKETGGRSGSQMSLM